jgi:hypothetical protein
MFATQFKELIYNKTYNFIFYKLLIINLLHLEI